MNRGKSNLTKFIPKKLDSSIDRVRRKGHERLTVMVIPHGKEEVFSLQLNWSMILFLAGIIFIAVGFSFYGFYWRAVKSREIAHLEQRYGRNLHTAVTIKKGADQGLELREELLDNLREISTVIGMRERAINTLPDANDAEARAYTRLRTEMKESLELAPSTDYLPPVYSLRSFYFSMKDQVPLLKSLQTSVKQGLGVYSGMPLGRPVRMNGVVNDTSQYGRRINPISNSGWELHAGTDMAAPHGTPTYATGEGTVFKTTYSRTGYGNSVVIQHDNGFYALYAHLSSIHVRKGQKVRRGQRIGSIGNTGRTTGAHLHYEVRMNNSSRIDPMPYVCSTDLKSRVCKKVNKRYKL